MEYFIDQSSTLEQLLLFHMYSFHHREMENWEIGGIVQKRNEDIVYSLLDSFLELMGL